MRRSAPLVLGLVVALLVGCGQSNPKLIPQSNADALNQTADAIQAACSQHDTSEARKQAKLAANEIAELPRTVDADLRDNLDAWIEQIRKRISDDCKAEETPTPSPAETATEAPTESPTQAPTETPTKAPTETPTQAPTDTPTEAPTEAPTQAPTEAPTTTPVP